MEKPHQRYHILWIIFLSIIARVPRIDYIFGLDGAYLIWEAKLLLQGEVGKTWIHPTSYLSGFPYSPYPIGSLLIVAMILVITAETIWLTILLYNLLAISLLSFTSYRLFNYLFDEKFAFLGTVMYVNLPFYLLYSYTNLSARSPFLILFPLVILHGSKALQENSLVDWLIALSINLSGLLFHRMSKVLLVIIIALGLWIGLTKIRPHLKPKLVDQSKRFHLPVTLLLFFVLLSYPFSFIIGDISSNLSQLISTPFGILNYYVRISTSLYQKMGLILIIPGLLVFRLISKREVIWEDKTVLSLLLQSPLWILLSNIVYVSYLCSISAIILSLVTLQHIADSQLVTLRRLLVVLVGILMLSMVFVLSYVSQLWLYVLFMGIIILFLLLVLPNFIPSDTDHRRVLGVTLILIVLINSMFLLDFSVHFSLADNHANPGEMYTEHQQAIAEYLATHSPSTIWTYTHLLSGFLAMDLGWHQLDDPHNINPLLSGYTTLEDIDYTSEDIMSWIGERHVYELSSEEVNLHQQLIMSSYQDNQTQLLLEFLNIDFFIGYVNSTQAEFKHLEWISSPFIRSLQEFNIPIVFSSGDFVVYRLR